MSSKLKSRLLALATLVIFIAALWVLRKSLANMNWADVRAHISALPLSHLGMALLFVMGSYLALSFHDFLAVRFVGGTLSWRAVAPTAFIAVAVGQNLGVTTLTGGAVRLHDYSRKGLSTAQVGGIVAMCAITFALGVNLLLDFSLLFEPQLAAQILHIEPDTARWLGVANISFLLGWLWLTAGRSDKPFTLGGHRFTPPRASLTLRQITVGALDLSCSAAALYWLLPDLGSVGFAAFLGSYVLAMAAGIASNVPGGLGVFESMLLLTLPEVPKAELIGGALAFRACYFLLPFMLALILLGARELPRLRRR